MVKSSLANTGNARDLSLIFGGEDPLEYEIAICSGILAWEIPWAEEGCSPWSHRESDTTEQLSMHTHAHMCTDTHTYILSNLKQDLMFFK